jgi:hypothetical protein
MNWNKFNAGEGKLLHLNQVLPAGHDFHQERI